MHVRIQTSDRTKIYLDEPTPRLSMCVCTYSSYTEVTYARTHSFPNECTCTYEQVTVFFKEKKKSTKLQNLKAQPIYQNAESVVLISLPRHQEEMKSNNGSRSQGVLLMAVQESEQEGEDQGEKIPNHSSLLITSHVVIFTLDIVDTGGPFPCRARDHSKFDPASLESPRQMDKAFEINTILLRGHIFS